MHPFLMHTWSGSCILITYLTFKMCIASPILVTGSVNGSQNVYCVSDYCQRLWHMYSGIRSEFRRPDVKWHLYILPGDFLGGPKLITQLGTLLSEPVWMLVSWKKGTKNSTNFVTFLHFWSQLNFNWLCNLCSSKVFLWIFSFKEL
jgi:hypothetical protein